MAGQQRERAFHSLDDSFMDLGLCADHATLEQFGASRSDFYRELERNLRARAATVRARRVCEQCPVRTDCLGYALAGRIDDGIWGGTDGVERRAIMARSRRRAVGV